MLDAATSCFATDSARDDLVIYCKNLSLSRHKKICVDRIDLAVKGGQITGLIGSDGAGKTSLLHIIAGVIEPSSGEIEVLGKRPRDSRLDIAYVTQNNSLFPELTVEENLHYSAGVRNVSSRVYEELKEKYLEGFGLAKFTDRLSKDLSGGMKQKLALLCALISTPKLLLLDEPTSGLDPIARREFWQMLSSVCEDDITAVVATPRMEEGELCSEIAWMHDGRVYCTGSPRQLRQESNACRLFLRSDDIETIKTLLLQPEFMRKAGISSHTMHEADLVLLVSDAKQSPDLVLEVLNESGVSFEMHRRQASLDDVFVVYQDSEVKPNDFDGGLINRSSISNTRTSAGNSGMRCAAHCENVVGSKLSSDGRSTTAIRAANLEKRFGNFNAVQDLSLVVKYGEIYGLLGANGAGKTSTIKMICGLLRACSGEVLIAGARRVLNDHTWRSKIGYMSQKMALYRDLTVWENLQFYGATYGLSEKTLKARIDSACDFAQLSGSLHVPVGVLPGGLQQRLAFITSILHEPEILVLDEPTSGIDPFGRREIWQVVKQLAKNGVAVLVTTHFIEEAEYCDRIGVMTQGRLIGEGAPSEIKAAAGNVLEIFTPEVRDAFECVSKHIAPWRISILPDCLHIQSEKSEFVCSLIERELRISGLTFSKPRLISPSLEEAVISLVHDSGGAAQ